MPRKNNLVAILIVVAALLVAGAIVWFKSPRSGSDLKPGQVLLRAGLITPAQAVAKLPQGLPLESGAKVIKTAVEQNPVLPFDRVSYIYESKQSLAENAKAFKNYFDKNKITLASTTSDTKNIKSLSGDLGGGRVLTVTILSKSTSGSIVNIAYLSSLTKN